MAEDPNNVNLNRVVDLCYEMLEIADYGDKLRQDDGCGVVYGLLRDAAYKVRRLAMQELEHHCQAAKMRGFPGRSLS